MSNSPPEKGESTFSPQGAREFVENARLAYKRELQKQIASDKHSRFALWAMNATHLRACTRCGEAYPYMKGNMKNVVRALWYLFLLAGIPVLLVHLFLVIQQKDEALYWVAYILFVLWAGRALVGFAPYAIARVYALVAPKVSVCTLCKGKVVYARALPDDPAQRMDQLVNILALAGVKKLINEMKSGDFRKQMDDYFENNPEAVSTLRDAGFVRAAEELERKHSQNKSPSSARE